MTEIEYNREYILMCVSDFYWNITKPYFKFIKGKKYNFRLSSNTYYSIDCDYIFTTNDIGIFFILIDTYRNIIIDKIFLD